MDSVITSAQNPIVKQLRRLMKSSKARRDARLYIAEGIHVAQSYVDTGALPVRAIYALSAVDDKEVTEIRRALERKEVEQVVVTDQLFTSFASIHAAVGVVLIFEPPATKGQAALEQRNSILLDEVQDPGNMGTILRTAAAAGIEQAVLSEGCASPWSPKALRAGMGAQFNLIIHEEAELVSLIQGASVPVFATTLSPQSQSLYSLDLSGPAAWLFGSEGQGLRPELIKAAQIHVTIPQHENSVESLNVSAAAAVCLYEQYRQQN